MVHFGQPGYGRVFHAQRDAELARLQAFAEAYDPFTRLRLTALPIPVGGSILEVGPGSGETAVWLRQTYQARELVVLDRDPHLLARLEPVASRVVHADLTENPEPPGQFDLIHARFVLMHLSGRHDIAQRLASWLRPGGWLVLGDAVDASTLTDHEQIIRVMRLARRAADAVIGSDFTWAPSFPAPLRRAGLVDLGVGVDVPIVRPDNPTSAALQMTLQGLAAPAVSRGVGSMDEFDEAVAALSADDLLSVAPLGLVTTWGRRP